MFGGSIATIDHRSPRLVARRGWLRSAVESMFAWDGRARSRRQLCDLDDRLLKDIGISRADALCEALKPFWKA